MILAHGVKDRFAPAEVINAEGFGWWRKMAVLATLGSA